MLDAKAPLYGEVDCEETLPAESEMSLRYTVTNVGEKSVTIAARFEARIRLLRIRDDQARPDKDMPRRPATQRGQLSVDGKKPVTLAPGANHTYPPPFYARGVGAGRRVLSMRFEHRAEEPPADEVVPPSIAGVILTFQ